MFKRSLYLAALSVLTISLYAFSANAQEQGSSNQGSMDQGSMANGQHEHGRGQMDPAAHTKELAKKLNLTADQQTKVQSILEDQQKQFASLRNDSSLSQQDRRSKFMALHENTVSQIRSVLTDDQQKKFDAMEQQHKERGNHERRGGWNETPPSPQSNPQNPQ